VVIRRSWFNHLVWFFLFFCIAWDSFLVFWYSMALGGTKGPMSVIALVFPLAHVAVGVGLTYFVLCTFFNKTDVILSSAGLTVRTHPLPWRGNRTIAATDLVSVFYRERTASGRRNSSVSYDLMYVDSSNREQMLVKGLPNEEQAAFLEDAVTRYYFPEDKR
jgi:hypothetical protein